MIILVDGVRRMKEAEIDHDEELLSLLDKMAHRMIAEKPMHICCSKIVRGVIELHGYEELVDAVKNCRVTVVNFYSTNCPYCRAFHPIFEYVASKYIGKAGFYRLNIDYSPETAWRLNIMGTPTTILFINGEPADLLYGYTYPEILEKHIITALRRAKCLDAN